MRWGCNCRHLELNETVLVFSNVIVFDTVSVQPTPPLYTATLNPSLIIPRERETPVNSCPESVRRLLAHSTDDLRCSSTVLFGWLIIGLVGGCASLPKCYTNVPTKSSK